MPAITIKREVKYMEAQDALYEQVLDILADIVIGYCFAKMQTENVDSDLEEAA